MFKVTSLVITKSECCNIQSGKITLKNSFLKSAPEADVISVTRSGDFVDFGQLFKAFGNN